MAHHGTWLFLRVRKRRRIRTASLFFLCVVSLCRFFWRGMQDAAAWPSGKMVKFKDRVVKLARSLAA